MVKKYIALLVVLTLCPNAFAQENPYRFVHFEELFKEGIYISFEQFALQQPIKAESIIAMENKSDPDFLTKILSYERFSFFDAHGHTITSDTEKIWGLVHKNTLYIWHEHMLSKIHYSGRWSYFISYKTATFPDVSIAPGSYYAMQIPLNSSRKVATNIIDLKTGDIKPLNKKNLSTILANDSTLLQEYNELSKRKQRQLKYLYIRKINDLTPFNLPVKNSN